MAFAATLLVCPRPAFAQQPRVSAGQVLPGFAIAVATELGAPQILCEPSCELDLPRGRIRIGWRHEDRDIEWQHTIDLERDLRIDLHRVDRSGLRQAGYGLLGAAGILLVATAIVGIATEPRPPESGVFGRYHPFVFAGIAGGIALAFGAPGVALAVVFEQDTPGIEVVPAE